MLYLCGIYVESMLFLLFFFKLSSIVCTMTISVTSKLNRSCNHCIYRRAYLISANGYYKLIIHNSFSISALRITTRLRSVVVSDNNLSYGNTENRLLNTYVTSIWIHRVDSVDHATLDTTLIRCWLVLSGDACHRMNFAAV